MKLKLFNGTSTISQFNVLGGGFDTEAQRVTLIVERNDGSAFGIMTFDVAEARRVSGVMLQGTPEVVRVSEVATEPKPLFKVEKL